MPSLDDYAVTNTFDESFQNWLSAFDNLLSSWYTDPANEQDDIDRIYRQEEAQEWLDLLEAYGRGEVEYNTLINWQPDFLRDIEGFNDYIADVRFQATWERNANYNIAYCEENGCRDEAMQRFYDKWKASGSPDSKDGMWSDQQFDEWLAEQPEDPVGPVDPGPEPPQTLDEMLSELAEEQQVDRDVVDGVVDMIETIKGSIPTDLESASDLIKGVLSSTVLGSALEECERWTGNTTTEGGMGVPNWTKCVDVGIFGIPGLDLPLPPGMVDISTSVYDIIQKGEDIGESFEDFLEDPSGWLENVIDKAVEKVQDVWGDLQAGVDPKTIGGLSGILNDWIGNILGGYILGQVKDATSAIDPFLYAGDCLDRTFKEANEEYCEDALNQGTLVDCSTFGKTGDLVTSADQCGPCQNPDFTPTGANGECVDPDPNDCAGQNKSINSNGSCGDCLGSLKEIGGECVEPCQYNDTIAASSPECKEPWTDGGDTEAECTAQGRLHVPGDASTETESSCGGCLPTHTEEAGECTEWADGGPTQEECESQGKVHRPSTGTGRDSSCGGCLDGYELVNGQCTEEGLEEPCPGNQIRNEETRECEDPGPDFVEGDPCTTEEGKAGTYNSEGICIPDWVNEGPTVDQCKALNRTHISGDPSEKKSSDCGDCLNDTFEEKGGECVEKVCDESSFQEEVVETTTIPYGQGQPRVQAPTYTEVNGVCTKTTYEVIVADPTQADCEAEGKALSEDGKSCVEPTPCTNGATLESGCEQCKDGSSPSDYEGGKCGGKLIVTPETCGPETFTAERTVEASVGSGEVKDPTVKYMVENGECTKVTTVYVAGPVIPPGPPGTICADGTSPSEGEECVDCPAGSRYLTSSTSEGCIPGQPPTDCASQGREQVDEFTCGECLPEYQAEGNRCIPIVPPEGCEDPTEADFGNDIGCEQPCPDNADIGISDALCGDTTVTTCLDDTASNFNEEGPCVYGPIEETCENGATDYPECTQCADGSLPDANLGCGGNDTCDNGATDWPLCSECPDGTPTDPDTPCSGGPSLDCDDLDYAAANPLECPGVCEDCTCPEYVAANPDECSSSPPPPPPPPPEGGGGGSAGQGKREPIDFGISADPELLARKQFPITDYLSGLFTGNR